MVTPVVGGVPCSASSLALRTCGRQKQVTGFSGGVWGIPRYRGAGSVTALVGGVSCSAGSLALRTCGRRRYVTGFSRGIHTLFVLSGSRSKFAWLF